MMHFNYMKNKRGFLWPFLKSTDNGLILRRVTRRYVFFSFILTLSFVSMIASLYQVSYETTQIGARQRRLASEPRLEQSLFSIIKRFFQTRTETAFSEQNEQDEVLANMYDNNPAVQELLKLKKQQILIKEFGKMASSKPQIEYENSNSFFYDGKPNTDSDIHSNSVPSRFKKSDYFNSASDETWERGDDYGAVMEKQASNHDYDLYLHPDRRSLIYNTSKHLEALVRKNHLQGYYSKAVTLLPKQTKGVVILTNYRSGSTFLGELFNQHPDAFYTFEPLYPFTGDCDIQGPKMAKVLSQNLKCDFPSMKDVYEQVRGPMRKSKVDIRCLLDNFCFRKFTKELCAKDLCPLGKPNNCKRCGPVHLSRAKNVCRDKKVSVVKVIRLCDIQQLKKIIEDPYMDMKIVHLVRDPRGIESSRSKIHKNWSMKSNAGITCKRLLHNGLSGLADTTESQWLKGRYMSVRYEDLSTDPIRTAEDIYKFVGLEMTPELLHWINGNTRAPTRSKVNPYTTRRDSASVMQAWRQHLSMEQVEDIQNVCADAMDFFGYKPVADKTELDNLDVRLVN